MSKFSFQILYLLAILFIPICPLWGDHIHDPHYIFDTLPNGTRAPNPKRTTNGAFLHLDDIKGSIRNPHQRLKAAIIDSSFSPKHTKILMDKGVIHPAALQKLNPYALVPNEELNTSSHYSDLLSKLKYERMFTWNSTKRLLLQKQIDHIQPLSNQEETTNDLIRRRNAFYNLYTKKGTKIHGSAVMEALHLMAPNACLLPIDLCILDYAGYNKPSFTEAQVLTKAIRAAITHRVDVINISRTMEDLDTESLAAIKEAINKGIVVVLAAGNGGYSSVCISIWKTWNSIKGLWTKSKSQTLFEEVKGKRLLFAGALKYTGYGKEQVSDFTQLPEPVNGANPHFILAPGENLRLPIESESDKLTSGTSFAAPISSGAYLLLKQHAIENSYSATPENILNIMEESGRNLTYTPPIFGKTKILKTLDVHAARILLDQKFRAKPRVTYKSKPLTTISQRPIQKTTAVKSPAPRTTAVKKPLAKATAAKSPASRTTAVKKPAAKATAVKSPAPRTTAVKKPAAKTTAAKSPAPRTTAVKKPAPKATAAKSPAPRTTAVKKPAAKTSAVKSPAPRTTAVKKPAAKTSVLKKAPVKSKAKKKSSRKVTVSKKKNPPKKLKKRKVSPKKIKKTKTRKRSRSRRFAQRNPNP